MPQVEVHQSNQPPQTPPPPRDDDGRNVWPVVIVILLVVLAIVFFIFTRDEAPGETDRTDVEVTLPEVRTPEAPDVEINVPDQIDVNIGTKQPEAPSGTTTQAPPPPDPNR
ncbi:MAG TPA: hypothetical protein VMS56_01065 [Thermoanaerobaculia bacterium]|nr:hypothetical protein [Thermoanaerobaculia bacterium]